MRSNECARDLDITARVGCSLSYEVTGSAWLLLNLRLAPDAQRSVLFEAPALGNDLDYQSFDDSNGNRVCRVTLEPGAPEVAWENWTTA